MDFASVMDTVGKAIDAAGVAAIFIGVLVASVVYVSRCLDSHPGLDSFRAFRQSLGRSILLGLELLVAGDIVRTVAVAPTFESVGVLVVIVLIRTFLSYSLELELTGRWPWQKGSEAAVVQAGADTAPLDLAPAPAGDSRDAVEAEVS